MNSISGIYEIRNKVNGHCYIGSSVDIQGRWYQHKKLLSTNKSHCRHLQNAYNKYGADAFIFEVIEYCGKEQLIEREQFHIDGRKPEYNIRIKAESNIGLKRTDEVRKNMSIAQQNSMTPERRKNMSEGQKKIIVNSFSGKKHSNESREKMSKGVRAYFSRMIERIGVAMSESTRLKIGAASKGNKYNLGRKASIETREKMSQRVVSPETRAKMSAARIGKKHTLESRAKMSIARNNRNQEDDK